MLQKEPSHLPNISLMLVIIVVLVQMRCLKDTLADVY
jgi:hypothetical protein